MAMRHFALIYCKFVLEGFPRLAKEIDGVDAPARQTPKYGADPRAGDAVPSGPVANCLKRREGLAGTMHRATQLCGTSNGLQHLPDRHNLHPFVSSRIPI